MLTRQPSRVGIFLAGAICALALASCKNGGGKRSGLAKWVDSPTTGTKAGNVIAIPDLGVQFEVPDTLYVFKECGEASHTPDGPQKWIPVVTCRSTTSGEFGSFDDSAEEDPFADDEIAEASGAEEIALTFYVTKKTRPLDERAVSWFENQYKQNGLVVDEISYQSDYQKKSGIYAKLHMGGGDGETPTREIVQFLFPREDVVFIARTEYPFGDTRAIDQDWGYILWNFDFTALGAPPPKAEPQEEEEDEYEEPEPEPEDDLGL
jgi:hypothetical protein